MKVLVIGSGGREHALCAAVAKSKHVQKIYCAPGNAGTAQIAENIALSAEDMPGLLKFAKENSIGLTVVGPEVPLANGIVDMFESAGLKAFGPNKAGAQMEGSKAFMKMILAKYKIPTAAYGEFSDSASAAAYVKANTKYPLVVKADGLAAGKGVIICADEKEALAAVTDIMDKKIFGGAGTRLIIEEFLDGDEASILAVVDGKNFILLPASQDHKKVFEDDKGPNTGGMGSYTPTPLIKADMIEKIKTHIITPTVAGLKAEGIVYKGILYAGIMITKDGPKVLEYNVRFGDPETQSILPLIKSDIVEMFLASVDGTLDAYKLELEDKFAVCIVLASKGYPGDYEKGKVIKGLDAFARSADVFLYHAGTKKSGADVVTSGGRVLNLVAMDSNLSLAIKKAYDNINKVTFDGVYFRRDIAKRAQKY